jgi:hypothetical protein
VSTHPLYAPIRDAGSAGERIEQREAEQIRRKAFRGRLPILGLVRHRSHRGQQEGKRRASRGFGDPLDHEEVVRLAS